MIRPLRWLHLSDLHLGHADPVRSWQVGEEFAASIQHSPFGDPPDVLLLSGDLTDSGTSEQFGLVDAFLDNLCTLLGGNPVIIPVPGNHDVLRPDRRRAREFRILDDYPRGRSDELVAELIDQLWSGWDASPIAPLFAPYTAWRARYIVSRPGVEIHASHFPGDLRVELALPGVTPTCFIGLNTAWRQYRDGNFHGALELPLEQFYAALARGSDPLALLRASGRRNLLVTHHAPSWLRNRDDFFTSIFPPDRFVAHLHGQRHGPASTSYSGFGGPARHTFQVASLFGRPRDEKRPLGYAWGSIAIDGELKIWPIRHIQRPDQTRAFIPDTDFDLDDEHAFILRPRDLPVPAPTPTAPGIDLTRYLQDLRDTTSHIDFAGLARTASCPIEQLYVRLHAYGRDLDRPREGDIDLDAVLAENQLLLVEGQPGAGKTTFLKRVANGLARGLLDEPGWRAVALGLCSDRRVPLPVFVRISQLLGRTHADRLLLLDWLAEQTCPKLEKTPTALPDPAFGARRKAWDARLAAGDAALLLDGLDEVGDPAERRRVFAMLDDILKHWPKCRLIVSSRPIALGALRARGFHLVTVAPFDHEQIRDFVARWIHALRTLQTDIPRDASLPEQQFSDSLFAAMRDRHEIRQLAQNPVMLTCLCVVHWNEKGLPDGRANVYRKAIHWLLEARKDSRERWYQRHAVLPLPLEQALAALALAMMDARGKRSHVDLRWAAEQLDPVVGRYFPAAHDPPTRVDEIGAWLRFECEYSGVVEELAGGQLRFWHLTFQEFLAALRLSQYGDNETQSQASQALRPWWPLVRDHLSDIQWRETIDMFPACLIDRGNDRVDVLLHRILYQHGLEPNVSQCAEITGVVGRLQTTLRAYEYQLPSDLDRRYSDLRAVTMQIFEPANAAQIEEHTRISAADALARVGDPRLTRGRFFENLIPLPGENVFLGKYPVTVEEYARFVADRGYQRDEYWDTEGLAFREKYRWHTPAEWEAQLAYRSRPVVRVSWFEAMAYCRWLKHTHQQTHLEFRLPTQAEWRAAASPDGRSYPWGTAPDPDSLHANFGERINRPTPVGIYPAGDGLHGHCDLAGNVWEWGIDIPEIVTWTDKDRREFGLPRYLFGGSYKSENVGSTAVREGLWTGLRHDCGFRVVAVPADDLSMRAGAGSESSGRRVVRVDGPRHV